MKPRLIVTADDFGISRAVSEGIVDAHQRGIVTATSVLMTSPVVDECLPLLAQVPQLSIGVHLSLTFGRPLSQAGQWLADDEGNLSARGMLWRYSCSPRRFVRVAAEEWSEQIRAAQAAGVIITHLDSHHHVHHVPGLQTTACSLAQHCNIPRIRVSDDRAMQWRGPYAALYYLARRLRRRAARQNIATNDIFCGAPFLWAAADPLAKQAALQHILEPLRTATGTIELYCHPGRMDPDLADDYREGRVAELAALTTPSILECVRENFL